MKISKILRRHDPTRLAEVLGVQYSTVSRWVKEETLPQRRFLPAISVVTGVPMNRLLAAYWSDRGARRP